MKTLFLIAAACIALAATPAISQEDADYSWKPHVSSCKTGNLEGWLRTHGHKFVNGYVQIGPLLIGEIAWDSGKRETVFVGPHGNNNFCVLASTSGDPA